jgi:hypothetical protein
VRRKLRGIAAAASTALLETHSPWMPFFEFQTIPVIEVEQAVLMRAHAWRDSVK